MVNNKEALVYDDPPDIIVKDGVLNISFNPNNTRRWTDYKEEFRCIAENGYSKDMAQVNITVLETMPPGEIDIRLRFHVLLRVYQTARLFRRGKRAEPKAAKGMKYCWLNFS